MRSLVMGMAFVTELEAAQMVATAKKNTSSAPARDRSRLLQLQKDGFDIIVCTPTDLVVYYAY
jgi:hypothetical protein